MFFQEKILKESHTSLLPAKAEKENRFLGKLKRILEDCYNILDHTWLLNPSTMLIALCYPNKLMIFQNDSLKKTIDFDISNLSFIDIEDKETSNEEVEDVFGINTILDDIV